MSYKSEVEAVVQEYCLKVTPAAKGSEYLDVLQKNTERLQGSLVLLGYEMLGGQDSKIIVRAALAIEMLHAYVACLNKNIAIDQALRAAHEAEIILANLETDPTNRLKALSITNRTMMLAALARAAATPTEDRLYWQATELALNPLHVGQVLTGSDCDPNNAVTPYAISLASALIDTKNRETHRKEAEQALESMKPFTTSQYIELFRQLI
jgi:hypothetical protein